MWNKGRDKYSVRGQWQTPSKNFRCLATHAEHHSRLLKTVDGKCKPWPCAEIAEFKKAVCDDLRTVKSDKKFVAAVLILCKCTNATQNLSKLRKLTNKVLEMKTMLTETACFPTMLTLCNGTVLQLSATFTFNNLGIQLDSQLLYYCYLLYRQNVRLWYSAKAEVLGILAERSAKVLPNVVAYARMNAFYWWMHWDSAAMIMV